MKTGIIDKHELLSAFVDEEASEFEVQRLCRELLNDEHQRARLGRYHLIRDALRDNLPPKIDTNFAAGVMAVIDREPSAAVAADTAGWRTRLLNPAAGFGLAASIAVCAVLGFQSYNDSSSPGMPAATVAQINPSPAPSTSNSQLLRQVDTDSSAMAEAPQVSLASNPEVAARLNSYLVNHSEYAPSRGMMPYARVVVGYESDQ